MVSKVSGRCDICDKQHLGSKSTISPLPVKGMVIQSKTVTCYELKNYMERAWDNGVVLAVDIEGDPLGKHKIRHANP